MLISLRILMMARIRLLNVDLSRHKLLIMGGLLSTLAYVYLAFNAQYYGDADLFDVLCVMFFCAAICFSIWIHYWRQNIAMPLLIVIGFAVVFRLIAVSGFPLLEDDMYRYLWDGRTTILTGSPYLQAPAEYFSATNLGQPFEEILGLINYPFVATVYGPVCQWIFAMAYLIAPGEIWPLQVFFALIDIGIILILSRLTKPLFVMLYAWSPLIINEFSFTAHPDVLGAFLLLIAYVAYQRDRFVLLGSVLALAMGVKIFALIVAPILLGFKIRGWLSFLVMVLLISLPWGLMATWFPKGLQAMGENWLFNAPIYFLFQAWLSLTLIKYSLLLIFVLGYGWYYFYLMNKGKPKVIRLDILFMALFLCTPVFNPWYLVWLLPFAVLTPSVWAWVASVSLLLSYVSGINLSNPNLGAYQLPVWVVWIEFGPILAISWIIGLFKPVSFDND